MKKVLTSILFLVLTISIVSAVESGVTVILNDNQLKEVYNIGDSISAPVTIKSLKETSGTLEIFLICNGKEINFYKNDIPIYEGGGEQREVGNIFLSRDKVGLTTGTCTIKATYKDENDISEKFKISDKLTINLESGREEYNPEEEIIIEGEVIKENGEPVNGFIKLDIIDNNKTKESQLETVNNGFFSITLIMPKETKAGTYLAKLSAYERDSEGEDTNKGFMNYNFKINQIPTSLEIVFEDSEIIPGNTLKVKAILHDQTGEKIDSIAVITIKNSADKILTQQERQTDEFLEYEVSYKEPPTNWTIFAISNQLDSEKNYRIKENKKVEYQLENETLIITNVGNVIYNDTASIKIGEEILSIPLELGIDGSKTFLLKAPDGEYEISILYDEGSETIGSALLTGKAIQIKESKSIITKIFNPFVWIFVIVICSFITFMVFKKGYNRTFIGYVHSIKEKYKKKENPTHSKTSLRDKSANTATLSLSIKGDKQPTSVVCLKIKNFNESLKKENNNDIIQHIIHSAENRKATTYETGEYIFFILAPAITRTFKNEITAIELAKSIQTVLTKHNHLAQEKIEFGLSVHYGQIIGKKEEGVFKFMSLGNLMAAIKKIASISDQEILLTKDMDDRLKSIGGVKTEKQTKSNQTFYIIKQIRDKEKDKKFLDNFVKELNKK